MARKVGQIVRRGERTWLVRIYLGRDQQTKKRKYFNHTIHGPAKQAQMYLTKKLRERDLRRGVECVELTVDEYLDRWLQTAAKPRLRSKSYDDYESLLRRYIRPVLGVKLLSSVSTLDIQGAYQQMIEAGLSSRTVRYTHAVVRSALRQATKWKLLFDDPIAGVQLPRDCRREIRVLSLEQVRSFLKAALATPFGAVLAVAVTTGMRPSEYLALKWADVDWERGTVSVTRTLQRRNGNWQFADTKRTRSRRVIKLQNWVLNLLRGIRTAGPADATNRGIQVADLIFTTAEGEPLNEDRLARREFKAILEQAGLRAIRLYDLRHTAATVALSAGVPPKIVSEQLGHASAAFTLDVYSHVLPHIQAEAAAKVEALLIE
jgi:integrase